MATEGLPLQEHGSDRGVLAGSDFLSVFMTSSLQLDYEQYQKEISTTQLISEVEEDSHTRTSRSISFLTSPPIAQNDNIYASDNSAQFQKLKSSDFNLNDGGVVVAVRVSSHIGSIINKEPKVDETTGRETTTEMSTLGSLTDRGFIASEQRPSIIVEANKNEFSVEEGEPISSNSDLHSSGFNRAFPADVRVLPRNQFGSNTDFITQLAQDATKDKLPVHHTVIYHNREPGRGRSVSYSTVIQGAAPHPDNEKHWDEDKHHERRERNYEGSQISFTNNFNVANPKLNETKIFPHHKGKLMTPTSHPKEDINWEKPEQTFTSDVAIGKQLITTERNWEMQERPYPPPRLPMEYGQPEQNYEVDESASVMTNGRAHGVQPAPTVSTKQEIKTGEDKKADDNQKVGYVVEGRNYRKYRVEERTSDGFIVGEYGVVSHDDGSLRGVRYTADGTINPRLIYDALMKFLAL